MTDFQAHLLFFHVVHHLVVMVGDVDEMLGSQQLWLLPQLVGSVRLHHLHNMAHNHASSSQQDQLAKGKDYHVF
jgi:hypothetical protein